MKKRYIVTKPVEGGDAYYRVADTESTIADNFAVAQYSTEIACAEAEAKAICDRLNGEHWDTQW